MGIRRRMSEPRTDPLRNFRFTLSIEGIGTMGFKKISGLNVDLGTFSYPEGGRNMSPRIFPDKVKWSNIVLHKGLAPTPIGNEMLRWMRQRFLLETGQIQVPIVGIHIAPVFMKRLCVLGIIDKKRSSRTGGHDTFIARFADIMMDKSWQHPVQHELVIYDAWVKAYKLGDLDAQGNGILLQEITLAHNGWEHIGTSLLSEVWGTVARKY